MPNGHGYKEYGGHSYPNKDGTSDCGYDCGCWMGPSRSGGPTGVDPFGKCPQNPKDGKLLGGNSDYDYVVTERIRELERRAFRAEEKLKTVSPSKIKLAAELSDCQEELDKKNNLLASIRQLAEKFE